MSFCVVGGGKMGLSHIALITPYIGKSNVCLVERKRSVRLVFKLMGYNTCGSLDAYERKFGLPKGLIVATPTSSHAELAEWTISKSVPLFVEKPLTLDPERSAALVAMAESANVTAQVGFMMRYVATFLRFRELVNGGGLGLLREYRASMRGNVITKPPTSKNWQGDFTRGGGCLNEYGPHLIDLCRFIFGDIVEVNRAEKGTVFSTNADDWLNLDWKHANGATGNLSINWCDATKRKSVIEIEAEFDHATVRVDNSAIDIDFKDASIPDADTRALLSRPVQLSNVAFYLRGEEFSLEMEDFLGACLGQSLHVARDLPEGVTPNLYDGYVVDCLIDEISRKAGLK